MLLMPILLRPDVLVVLLEYIDLQSQWQYKTNNWEGLPCHLPLHIAVVHLGIAIVGL